MWFGELCSCCSKPVLPAGPAWVLPNYVLQTLFLSSEHFCLTLCLNLYRKIGSGLYIRRLIHHPAFIASKTVPLLQDSKNDVPLLLHHTLCGLSQDDRGPSSVWSPRRVPRATPGLHTGERHDQVRQPKGPSVNEVCMGKGFEEEVSIVQDKEY